MTPTAAFWSWSVPTSAVASAITNRFAVCAVETARLTREARAVIARVISWDLESLRAGQYATCNYDGSQFADGSKRAKLAGTQMRAKAVYAWWKGDQEAHVKSHFLDRHYGARLVSITVVQCGGLSSRTPISHARLCGGQHVIMKETPDTSKHPRGPLSQDTEREDAALTSCTCAISDLFGT